MNKAELIAKLADDAGLTKTQAGAALDSFTEAIAKTLKKGDKAPAFKGTDQNGEPETFILSACFKQLIDELIKTSER